jgi:serine/threonine protein kinase
MNGDLADLSEARCGRWLDDRWHLERILGLGGTSAVYAATHRNGRRAAIKVLHPQWSMMPTVRRRFLREGYISNKVEHPAVVAVLDDGETREGEAYLVLELLDGEPLSGLLAREGRLPPGRAVELIEQVLAALEAAHEKGIIHRDIKPENLMVLGDGSLKVLDFGIASIKTGDASATLATQPGSTRGTPTYMAPEQALGLPVDARTDLWAVGAVLYRALSGEPVRQASSVEATLVLAATRPARPLAHLRPDIPPGLAAVVDRSLTFEAPGRFPDAPAMLAALRAAPLTNPSAGNATLPEGAPAPILSPSPQTSLPAPAPASAPASAPAPAPASAPAPAPASSTGEGRQRTLAAEEVLAAVQPSSEGKRGGAEPSGLRPRASVWSWGLLPLGAVLGLALSLARPEAPLAASSFASGVASPSTPPSPWRSSALAPASPPSSDVPGGSPSASASVASSPSASASASVASSGAMLPASFRAGAPRGPAGAAAGSTAGSGAAAGAAGSAPGATDDWLRRRR